MSCRADQHRGGITGSADDDVEHPMDTVHQVHIERACGSKQHFGTGCPPACGMTSKVMRTEIGFCFRNYECDVSPIDAPHEYSSHQIARNHIGGPVKKSRSENGVSFLQPCQQHGR